jgi:hypothetical protein
VEKDPHAGTTVGVMIKISLVMKVLSATVVAADGTVEINHIEREIA